MTFWQWADAHVILVGMVIVGAVVVAVIGLFVADNAMANHTTVRLREVERKERGK